ncbi:hypothetical protein CapIbe_018120 [Capra ibex]
MAVPLLRGSEYGLLQELNRGLLHCRMFYAIWGFRVNKLCKQNLEVALAHHCFACLLSKASHKAKLEVSGPEKGTTNILNNTICQV